MTVFQITWPLPIHPTTDEKKRRCYKRKLNLEWTLVCVLGKDKSEKRFDCMEIHRSNLSEDFSVSGKLKLLSFVSDRPLFEETFYKSIKARSSFTKIFSNNHACLTTSNNMLHGFVNIKRIKARCPKVANHNEWREWNKFQWNSLKELSIDFEQLLDPKEPYLTDVTLKCDGASIKAHKIILSARSSVFAAMFAKRIKESRQKEEDSIEQDVYIASSIKDSHQKEGDSIDQDVFIVEDAYECRQNEIDVTDKAVSIANSRKERCKNEGDIIDHDVSIVKNTKESRQHEGDINDKDLSIANTKEVCCQNEVVISDIDASILRAVVTYMYTSKTPNLSATKAADLLIAADKYQLPALKERCSNFLRDTITLKNVVKILVLGDLHSETLKSYAVDYICRRKFSDLEKTEDWKNLQKDRPALAIEVLTSLANLW